MKITLSKLTGVVGSISVAILAGCMSLEDKLASSDPKVRREGEMQLIKSVWTHDKTTTDRLSVIERLNDQWVLAGIASTNDKNALKEALAALAKITDEDILKQVGNSTVMPEVQLVVYERLKTKNQELLVEAITSWRSTDEIKRKACKLITDPKAALKCLDGSLSEELTKELTEKITDASIVREQIISMRQEFNRGNDNKSKRFGSEKEATAFAKKILLLHSIYFKTEKDIKNLEEIIARGSNGNVGCSFEDVRFTIRDGRHKTYEDKVSKDILIKGLENNRLRAMERLKIVETYFANMCNADELKADIASNGKFAKRWEAAIFRLKDESAALELCKKFPTAIPVKRFIGAGMFGTADYLIEKFGMTDDVIESLIVSGKSEYIEKSVLKKIAKADTIVRGKPVIEIAVKNGQFGIADLLYAKGVNDFDRLSDCGISTQRYIFEKIVKERNILLMAKVAKSWNVELAKQAVIKIGNENTLLDIVKGTKDDKVAEFAAERIKSQDGLVNLVVGCRTPNLAGNSYNRLVNPSQDMLFRIADSCPDKKIADSAAARITDSRTRARLLLRSIGGITFGTQKKRERGHLLDRDWKVKLNKPVLGCEEANIYYTPETGYLWKISLSRTLGEGKSEEEVENQALIIVAQFQKDYGIELVSSPGLGKKWSFRNNDFHIKVEAFSWLKRVDIEIKNFYAVRKVAGTFDRLPPQAGTELLADSLDSFIGFKFATKKTRDSFEFNEHLSRPFRYLKTYSLIYSSNSKLLETIHLEGKAPDGFTEADRKAECEAIAKMFTDKYGLKFDSELWFADDVWWRCASPGGLAKLDSDISVEIRIKEDNEVNLIVTNKKAVKDATK